MRYFKVYEVLLLFTLLGCTKSTNLKNDCQTVIDFGNVQEISSSKIVDEYALVKLETTDESLVGGINQVEVLNGRIYILDREKSNSIFVFSLQGDFITKMEAKGNGPGEFLMPHSFQLTNDYLYVLDRVQSRLLKYDVKDLTFLEDIKLPLPSPLSFSTFDNKEELFIYYYPIRKWNTLNDNQIVVADKYGEEQGRMYKGLSSGRIVHGSANNIYKDNSGTKFYPYFSNNIYSINSDSVHCCYQLAWGDLSMPNSELFEKYDNSGDIMKRILKENWIRLLYVYETSDILMVKYYIKQDFYISYWNKTNGNLINAKANEIQDDLGLGIHFPLPVGLFEKKIIGVINPFDLDVKSIKDKELLKNIEEDVAESNPILIFYSVK